MKLSSIRAVSLGRSIVELESFVPEPQRRRGMPCFKRVVRVAGEVDVGSEEEKIGLSVKRLWIRGFLDHFVREEELEGTRADAAAEGVVMTADVVGGQMERQFLRVVRERRWCT